MQLVITTIRRRLYKVFTYSVIINFIQISVVLQNRYYPGLAMNCQSMQSVFTSHSQCSQIRLRIHHYPGKRLPKVKGYYLVEVETKTLQGQSGKLHDVCGLLVMAAVCGSSLHRVTTLSTQRYRKSSHAVASSIHLYWN